ncbi:type III-A CRISPR-associated RAMP protein Csm5 [Thermotoga profunda]|uniref:type III-A CRISPR-associated RAMP protein Csm5 n=1 Tax=Thermotoga profunda TaxID=1508420 RepID=UPI0005975708|nr:type III-A CRISPR-associated RAMP protein Csm5 [Thermotoga profunda]
MRQKISIKFKTFTPVFIGSGEKYTPCQIVNINSSYYKLRDMSFFRLLHNYPKLKEKDSLNKIANKTIPNVEKQIDKKDLFYEIRKYTDEINGEILQMIKHPSGVLYIPGSSIKGAIRTAIQYHIMKKNRSHFSEIIEIIKNKLKEVQQDPKRKWSLMSQITKHVDSCFRFENEIHTDFARFLIVRDTNLLTEPVCLVRIGVFKVMSQKLVFDSKKPTFLAEVIPPSMEFETEIIFDLDQMELMQRELSKKYSDVPKSIDQIFDCVREMYDDVIKDELNDLKAENSKYGSLLKKLQNQKDKIHIGYGGGLKACSLFILLDEELRKQVRNLIKNHGRDIAPLSRRSLINKENQPISPFGWFTFTVVK